MSSVNEKQLTIMQALEKKTPYPGAEVDATSLTCKNWKETEFLLNDLADRGLIEPETTYGDCPDGCPESAIEKHARRRSYKKTRITVEGWNLLEKKASEKPPITHHSVNEKQLTIMQALEKKTPYPGAEVDATSLTCKNWKETEFLLNDLADRGLIEPETTYGDCPDGCPESAIEKHARRRSYKKTRITAEGWNLLEKTSKKPKPPITHHRVRRTEIHDVIWAVYCDLKREFGHNPTCGQVWQRLENKYEEHDKKYEEYDHEEIIQEIKKNVIYWKNFKGDGKQQGKSSISTTLGRLKKKRNC